MSETIIAVIITGIVSVVCTILTDRSTRDTLLTKLETQDAVQRTEIEHLKSEIASLSELVKEYSSFAAKLVALQGELNVVLEKLASASHRIKDLEDKVG